MQTLFLTIISPVLAFGAVYLSVKLIVGLAGNVSGCLPDVDTNPLSDNK